ncbi:MAG TPA: hypothetical protein VGQ09_05620 [Chitinophagaceae bacterium]|jgi:drug/metabolite transporter (DMT)-like permease|nr:hypothetical protein [Chitinophagaceae bacterium]
MHLAITKNTSLSRSLLAGFTCGLIAAFLNAGYTFFYRKATEFTEYKVIEPMLIFIAFPLFFVTAGIIFFEMIENMKKGRLFFIILSLSLTVVAVILDLSQLASEPAYLLLGIILITGLLGSFLLPFLATHPKIFMDKEELSESVDS